VGGEEEQLLHHAKMADFLRPRENLINDQGKTSGNRGRRLVSREKKAQHGRRTSISKEPQHRGRQAGSSRRRGEGVVKTSCMPGKSFQPGSRSRAEKPELGAGKRICTVPPEIGGGVHFLGKGASNTPVLGETTTKKRGEKFRNLEHLPDFLWWSEQHPFLRRRKACR